MPELSCIAGGLAIVSGLSGPVGTRRASTRSRAQRQERETRSSNGPRAFVRLQMVAKARAPRAMATYSSTGWSSRSPERARGCARCRGSGSCCRRRRAATAARGAPQDAGQQEAAAEHRHGDSQVVQHPQRRHGVRRALGQPPPRSVVSGSQRMTLRAWCAVRPDGAASRRSRQSAEPQQQHARASQAAAASAAPPPASRAATRSEDRSSRPRTIPSAEERHVLHRRVGAAHQQGRGQREGVDQRREGGSSVGRSVANEARTTSGATTTSTALARPGSARRAPQRDRKEEHHAVVRQDHVDVGVREVEDQADEGDQHRADRQGGRDPGWRADASWPDLSARS